MVRLRREIDGLDWDLNRKSPNYYDIPLLREWMDKQAVELAERLVQSAPKRVLAVGAPQDLLIRWAAKGIQIQAVEPNPERAAALRRSVLDGGLMRHLSVVEKRYGMAAFETSSFDLALLFDEVNRVAIAGNVVRKCARELKVGGNMLLRFSSRDLSESAHEVRNEGLRSFGAVKKWAYGKLDRFVVGGDVDTWSIPFESFLDELATIVKVHETHRMPHTFCLAASGLAAIPQSILPKVVGIGHMVQEWVAATSLSPQLPLPDIVCVLASKSLGFGKVFRTGMEHDEHGR